MTLESPPQSFYNLRVTGTLHRNDGQSRFTPRDVMSAEPGPDQIFF
jgi:hypothetical protein